MNRREAIKKTSLMLGIAVSSPAVISILNGCVPKKSIDWQPEFLTREQANLVSEIAETILPKSETPGAKDMGVDAFIDHIVYNCCSQEEKQLFVDGLDALNKESERLNGNSFVDLDGDKKSTLLTGIENKAVQGSSKTVEGRFFLHIKELTLLGYFTSEEIMTRHLKYVPVPTRLEGCVEMENSQKLIVGNHV